MDTPLPFDAEGELLVEEPVVGFRYAKNPRRPRFALALSLPRRLRSICGDLIHTRIHRTGDITQYGQV